MYFIPVISVEMTEWNTQLLNKVKSSGSQHRKHLQVNVVTVMSWAVDSRESSGCKNWKEFESQFTLGKITGETQFCI